MEQVYATPLHQQTNLCNHGSQKIAVARQQFTVASVAPPPLLSLVHGVPALVVSSAFVALSRPSAVLVGRQVSQGYLQPDVGGKNIPTAEGELSDLAGDEPLFKALYQWCAWHPYV